MGHVESDCEIGKILNIGNFLRHFLQGTEDHKFAGSEFGRHRRLREVKVTAMEGRDQSAPD